MGEDDVHGRDTGGHQLLKQEIGRSHRGDHIVLTLDEQRRWTARLHMGNRREERIEIRDGFRPAPKQRLHCSSYGSGLPQAQPLIRSPEYASNEGAGRVSLHYLAEVAPYVLPRV